MNRIKLILSTVLLSLGLSLSSAFAALPWGSTAPLQVSGATPTCTYTSTALACIENMTAPVTSVTLAGMTAGTSYTLVLMQDGTGSRTLTQASVTGAPALTTAESAANGYAVWLITATSASAATFVSDYSNVSLADVFQETTASLGTAITGGTTQSQGSVVVPGVTVASVAVCQPQTYTGTNWVSGMFVTALTGTNFVQCNVVNPVGTATITPTAVSVNVRILKP